MGVAGYDIVKTKVIEGKKKCIYKKPKGTKEYVNGFGKMRSVESYIKLCKKAMASKVSKPKSTKSKKMRSRTARRYGGFLEFFADAESSTQHHKGKDVREGEQQESYQHPPPSMSKFTDMPPLKMPVPPNMEKLSQNEQKTGGSSCGRGGSKSHSGDGENQQGGKRKKNRTSKSSMLKMMMAAFRKKSKGKRRRGGEQQAD